MTDEFMRLAVTGSTYEDWKRMRRGLVEAHGRGDRYLREAARSLRDWPQEIPRDPPPSLPPQLLAPLKRAGILHDIDEPYTYPVYLREVPAHPDLADPGVPSRQAVRLARAFTGKLADRSIGVPGQGDLVGALSLVVAGVRVEVALEVEVKMPWGKHEDDQIAHQNAIRARGAIYVLARSVAEAVAGIRAARDAVTRPRP